MCLNLCTGWVLCRQRLKQGSLQQLLMMWAQNSRAGCASSCGSAIRVLQLSLIVHVTSAMWVLQVANAVRASAAAANIIGTEQPCRVRLRLWHCTASTPTAALEAPSLTIPDAVLCSEMGVHFSACGRFLAACVACQVRSLLHLACHDSPHCMSAFLPCSATVVYVVLMLPGRSVLFCKAGIVTCLLFQVLVSPPDALCLF